MPLIRDQHVDPNAEFVRHELRIGLNPAQSLTNAVLWLYKLPRDIKMIAASVYARAYTATAAFRFYHATANEVIIGTTLAIDATAEKFKFVTKTQVALYDGVVKTKAPATAIVFTLAHTVNVAAAAGTGHWGAILVMTNGAGTVSTKVVSADQDFATEALAIASLPLPDTGKLVSGYITIQVKTGGRAWTANTDDMTAASDVTAANFYSTADSVRTMTNAIAPVALTAVDGVIGDTDADQDEYLVLLSTTDGSMVLTDAALTFTYRTRGLRGRG